MQKSTHRRLMAGMVAVALALSACQSAAPTIPPTAVLAPPTALPSATRTASADTPAPAAPTEEPLAPATPRPAGNPVLVDRQPARGEELPQDQPIVLTFDQAMDRASVEQAVAITPAVDGAFEWLRDNEVAFRPSTGWERAARYAVDLKDTARSAAGLALARPEAFTVSTIGALEVGQTIPADGAQGVSADALITVLFNRPVVPLTGLAQQAALPSPVSFSPPIDGQGEWLNTSIYLFRPARPLAGGSAYQGRVAAGLKDATGALLESDYAWTFTIASPVVKSFDPGNNSSDIDLRQPISVTFSQKMNHASAEAAFSIVPPVKGAFRWADEPAPDPGQRGYGEQPAAAVGTAPQPAVAAGEVMGFWPEEDYERGTRYRVVVADTARAADGDSALRAAAVLGFRAIERPAVATTVPVNGERRADSGSGVNIRFTAPILPDLVVPNLRFDPPVSLTRVYTYYDQSEKRFYLNVDLRPSTRYWLTIGGAIADKHGMTIGQDTVVRFTTAALSPYAVLRAESQVGTYDGNRPTRLYAAYRNVSRLDFELASLTPKDFQQLTGLNGWENFRSYTPPVSQVIREWSVIAEPELNAGFLHEVKPEADGGPLAPGIYLLTLSAPEPAAQRGYEPARHILVVSKLHVALKQGDREALAWVTDLASGQPAAGLPVSFRDAIFEPLGAGATDAEGKLAAAFERAVPQYEPFYAVIGEPGQPTFGLGFNNWDQGLAAWDFNLQARYSGDPFNVYLYTDRPIYRPGQMVFFKGIARADDDARYAVIPDLKTIDLAISNDQGQQVFSATAPLNDNGTFNGAFALDNAASTGFYFINACVPDDSQARGKGKAAGLSAPAAGGERVCRNYGVAFQVAAYRAPEFEVEVAADKADYAAGETFAADVAARYFFGGSVAGAKVQWTLYARDYTFDRYRPEPSAENLYYSFGDYDTFWRGVGYNTLVANGEGVTGNDGRFSIRVPADLSQRKASAVFSLEVSVTDLNDQSVSGRASAVVHKSGTYLGIATDSYVGTVGRPAGVNLISVDWQGQPVAGQAATVVFYQRQWFTSQEEDANGYRQYTSVPSDTEASRVSIATGPDGKAAAVFTPTLGGEYVIKATGDGEGGPAASTSFYVSSDAKYVAWRVNNNDRIDLKADKQDYRVGETLRLLVPSPFSGTVNALLTVERGRFLDSRVVQLKSNSDILEIPVEAAYAPNVFLSVLIVKGVDESNGLPAFKLGYAGVKVDPGAFQLRIEVSSDRLTYAPRDTVTYDIRVTDAAGAPVQAELSLALVDKAVLSLADPNSQPIFDAFYAARGLGIRTADSLAVNVDRVTARITAESGKGGGGGGLAGAMDGLFVRQNFKDTAHWEAVIQTDAQGRARAQVALPDNLTTWVLDARAATPDTRVGQATHAITSTKALLIRPVTPRFFVVGDSAVLGAVVNNNTDADLQAEVTLEARGVSLAGDAAHTVAVKARGSARVDWAVTVDDAPSADLTFRAAGGGLEDSSKPGLAMAPDQGIPILRYAAPETVATAGDVSEPGRKTEVIALPPRLDTGQGQLDVQVDPSMASVIRNAYDRLQEYPYESTEMVASRLLTALALGGGSDPAAAARYAQRLAGSQRSDGSWGWWPGDSGNTTVTAWALLALARAQAAGHAVDANVLARAREHLTNKLGAADQLSGFAADRQAFLLFALTEAGAGESGRLGALYEIRERLSHHARALLAMSLDKAQPGDARVKTLLGDLIGGAIAGATGMFWQEKEHDWFSFGSSVRSTAIGLNALARLDPMSPLATHVVRWLMVARQGDGWETNQENAWSVMALSEWRAAAGETDPSYAWRVTLNDAAVMNGEAGKDSGPSRLAVAVGQLLRDQGNALAFERGEGDGRLYYTARLKVFLPAEEAKALNRGIVIARKYESADCAPKPGQPCPAIDGAAIGQNVRVRLTIVAPTDLYFVSLTDPLPAGAEAIDTSLKTSQQIATETEPPYFGGRWGWGWWWFSHTELRDDRAAVFASFLPAGTYEYAYLIRPSIAGTFKVMPASIEQTYFPETFGRSDGAVFTVTK